MAIPWDVLVKHFRLTDLAAMDKLAAATVEQLEEVPGIGFRTAEAVVEWFKHPKNRELIQKLKQAGVVKRT